MSKYKAVKTGVYASKKEARRAQELMLLQRCGDISDLREQVVYEVIPKQDGERAAHYIADFVYFDRLAKQFVVEDVKGVRTPLYILKRKLMLRIYGIRIREV